MQSMADIRLAKSDDARELKKLNDLFNGADCNPQAAIAQALAESGHEVVCVAAQDDTLIGFCCGQRLQSLCYPSPYGEITELYVMEAHRRRGLGRRLLEATERQLALQGVRHFHLLTGSGNATAQALYRACGYDITDEILLEKNVGETHDAT